MKKILSLLAVSALLFLGCDKVEFPNQPHSSVTPTNDTIRKILIEDFTGHTCQNCPSAARMIKDTLEVLYPGQIISMAVHYGWFAQPCPPHQIPNGATAGTFSEDFQILPEDADYNSLFQADNFALPAGLINRYQIFPSFNPQYVPDWPTTCSNILDTAMTAYIKIHPNYNTTTRDLNVTVSGLFMKDTTGTYNIALYLVEDGLVGAQIDGLVYNYNYAFDNVFRGCINTPGTVGGESLPGTTHLNGELINYTMTSTFHVPTTYDASKCKIIGIILKTSDQGVLQAAEEKLY